MYERLTALAYDKSPERRAELLRALTDLFVSAGAGVSRTASELYAEIVLRVLQDVAVENHVELAMRMADLSTAPHVLVRHLAEEPIMVANPVLRRSRVLRDRDLIELAKAMSRDHLMAISGRADLSEAVSDALVARGDQRVMQSIAANDTARLSGSAFGTLLQRAEYDPALRDGLASRSDVPPDIAEKLIPFLSQQLRERLKAMLAKASINALVAPLAESGEARRAAETSDIVERAFIGEASLAEAIAFLVPDERIVDIATLLGHRVGLSAEFVASLIGKPDPAPVAVICKVAGLPVEVFSELARLRARRLGQSSREAERMVRSYEALSAVEARRSLGFLKVRHPAGKAKARTAPKPPPRSAV